MYLFDKEDEEKLTEIWMSKDFDIPLSDFLKKYSKKSYINKQEQKRQSIERDKQLIAQAEAILQIKNVREEKLDGNI
ncbi:Uncharacterised protein [Streptococcus dysgalactiae]|uniref:Uncharacterized protein n=2 Tax=Streptococcus dysgalactiae TaxID=1334 RepID=A0AAE9QTY5_STREQ|nr:hypothetical protein [Streptococcus dysgalactiae]OCW99388.1 hypothetical protein BBG10_01545 [Streptococcus dysgalactiae subsp. equisimilis]QQC56032.1 hypothetical protein I6H73_03305 [Streptococcus dysgalactiae]WEQ84092.1 phage hypothetical protein [Streptococcus dysgalactiae subsp. equisimilis]SQG92623.1 Uncharacterised protein [Streptococcus dysgalactiae subsp. equisimilis]SUN70605.1 Uncharacterised protein [Streptococcus dysgalactiae]